jgi:hypothetical protein
MTRFLAADVRRCAPVRNRMLLAMVAAAALNAIGPILVYLEFAAANSQPVRLEGAYFFGVLIGQPLAFCTLVVEFVILGVVRRGRAERPYRFAALTTLAALPAVILLAWPQISLLGGLFTGVVGTHRPGSWFVVLFLGVALACAAVFAVAYAVGRATRARFIIVIAFAVGAPALVLASLGRSLGLPQGVHSAWNDLAPAQFLRLPLRPYMVISGPSYRHPCAVANGTSMEAYIASDAPPQVVDYVNSDRTSPNPRVMSNDPARGRAFKNPCGIVADWNGDVFVADRESTKIVLLHTDGDGHSRYVGSIRGNATELAHPRKIALDRIRNLYVLSDNGVLVFSPGALANAHPKRVVALDQKRGPCSGFAVDGQGEIFLKDCGDASATEPYIAVFAPRATGRAKPIRVISGPTSAVSKSMPMTVDARGEVVALTDEQEVVLYGAGAHGDVRPKVLLEGPLGLTDPVDISIGEQPALYVADHAGAVAVYWIAGPPTTVRGSGK